MATDWNRQDVLLPTVKKGASIMAYYKWCREDVSLESLCYSRITTWLNAITSGRNIFQEYENRTKADESNVNFNFLPIL
jgi:hypothetical protein